MAGPLPRRDLHRDHVAPDSGPGTDEPAVVPAPSAPAPGLEGRRVPRPRSERVAAPSPPSTSAGTPPPPRDGELLGDRLAQAGLLDQEELDEALARCRLSGERLGRVLVAGGVVRRRDLFAALSLQWGLPFLDLTSAPVDQALLAGLEPHALVRHGIFPVRVEGSRLLVATTERPDLGQAAAAERLFGWPAADLDWAVTTDWDIVNAVATRCADTLLADATTALARANPGLSARQVVTRGQRRLLTAMVAGVATAALLAPGRLVWFALIMANLLFAGSVAFKTVMSFLGAFRHLGLRVTTGQVDALVDAELPRYTILVPAYREERVVPALMANLGALDYPREKLEIILLLEEDDPGTLAAAKAAAPADIVRFVIVPDGVPKTKPKACNVGLAFATGEYLVIYDAEDRPEPDQLKKAVVAFRRGGPRLACVQAALNFYNTTENVLTRMFTLEYSAWFDLMLPAMDRLRLAIPLGGTSNHFRVSALRDIGGWDPYNVTEDADLGVRCAALGTRVAVINSTTYEEANLAVGNWIRQRSRWIKGYLQTTLVHSRRPQALIRHAGVRGAASFALLVAGTPATFLLAPVLWALTVLSLVPGVDWLHDAYTPQVLRISLFNLIVCNIAGIATAAIAAVRRRKWALAAWSLLLPAYWVLHSVSAHKGAWQLITKPFYWEKTHHGLTTQAPSVADHQT